MENWFIVKMVFQIVCGKGLHRAQYDEQWRLVKAENAHDAWQKAEAWGRREGANTHAAGEYVQWKFIGASAIMALHTEMDGAEIFATIREPWDNDLYMTELHRDRHAMFEMTTSLGYSFTPTLASPS